MQPERWLPVFKTALQHPSRGSLFSTTQDCANICAQETVGCFAELLGMGADMDGSPANERLTRQVQQFTTVRPVMFEAVQSAGSAAIQATLLCRRIDAGKRGATVW